MGQDNSTRLKLTRANALVQQKRYDEAIGLLKEVDGMERNPFRRIWIYRYISRASRDIMAGADLLLRQGRYPDALHLYYSVLSMQTWSWSQVRILEAIMRAEEAEGLRESAIRTCRDILRTLRHMSAREGGLRENVVYWRTAGHLAQLEGRRATIREKLGWTLRDPPA